MNDNNTNLPDDPKLYMTYYKRPKGRREEVPIVYINPEAETYLLENNIQISAEDDVIQGGFVVYFDDGKRLDDDVTPDEIIVMSGGRSCEDTMDEGVELLKKRAG